MIGASEKQLKKISLFLMRPRGNEWFAYGPMRVYLRIGFRVLEGRRFHTLDIASVVIDNSGSRSQGLFKHFLRWIEGTITNCGVNAIYIENVLDARFQEFFNRNNWTVMASDPIMPLCFYKLKTSIL